MFREQGDENNLEKKKDFKKGAIKNKEVIAKYDNALSSEKGQEGGRLGKLELLKQRLGLGGEVENFSSNIKTNLIDNDDVATFIDWKSSFNIFISYFLIFLILISGAFAYLTFLEKEKINKFNIYDEDIQKTKELIEKEELLVEEGLLFREKIGILEGLVDNHVYWSQFFSYVEKNTFEEVYFEKFSGDLEGEYNLAGVADNKYFMAAEQLKAFRQDELTESVDFTELSLRETENETEIYFDLSVKVRTDIFYK